MGNQCTSFSNKENRQHVDFRKVKRVKHKRVSSDTLLNAVSAPIQPQYKEPQLAMIESSEMLPYEISDINAIIESKNQIRPTQREITENRRMLVDR